MSNYPQDEKVLTVTLWRCPCGAEGFWPTDPPPPGAPPLCEHPSSGYSATRYVPASKSVPLEVAEGLVIALQYYGDLEAWDPDEDGERARDALRAFRAATSQSNEDTGTVPGGGG